MKCIEIPFFINAKRLAACYECKPPDGVEFVFFDDIETETKVIDLAETEGVALILCDNKNTHLLERISIIHKSLKKNNIFLVLVISQVSSEQLETLLEICG